MTSAEVTLRPGVPADLPAIAEVFLASREAAVPAMPPLAHAAGEVRTFVAGWDLTSGERRLWVAETGTDIVAFAELKGAWLDDLYVHPEHAGDGIGSALLDVVKAEAPDGFCLWVFESNRPARDFYFRHGCIELERTDGSGNGEQSPDLRLAWPGEDPVAFLRGLIDGVDAELGDVLARRAALTRAVQATKGASGRDPEREAEIVAALARRAPALGSERLARILDAVITTSLEAATEPD